MSGLTLLLLMTAVGDSAEQDRTMFEFSPREAPWRNIDDTVMGGRSASRMRIDDGRAVFAGVVSPENGGGFASVRSRPDRHDLAGYGGLTIRVRGDGKVYGLRIKTDRGFDGVNYQASFATDGAGWQEISIPFESFRPVYRGRPVPGHPTLDPASIKSLGLIVSRKQYGPFQLELDWIKAFR